MTWILTDMICDRCHKTTKTIGTVTIGQTLRVWCDECMRLAIEQKVPIQINDLPCERCGTRTVQGYHVFWTGHNQRWCEQCVKEAQADEEESQE